MPGERDLNKLENKLINYSKNSHSKSGLNKIFFWRDSKEERLINSLNKYYEKEKEKQFEHPLNLPWIINGLEREMSMITGGKQEQIKVSLHEDVDYLKAVEILKDLNQYYDILSGDSVENILEQ